MMHAVVLFGSPGSGKGTQASLLKNCLQVPHISTGDMLREGIREGQPAGAGVAKTMHAGALVGDEIVKRMVEERLAGPDAKGGFILDGYPRTRAQAEHLCGWLDARGIHEVVIHLVVDYNVIVARLAGRRQCPRCGTLYNIVSSPPRVAGLCDRDGDALVVREDDQESVIRERLAAYQSESQPLIDFFREKGRCLFELDASSQTPEALAFEVCRLIGSPEAGVPATQG